MIESMMHQHEWRNFDGDWIDEPGYKCECGELLSHEEGLRRLNAVEKIVEIVNKPVAYAAYPGWEKDVALKRLGELREFIDDLTVGTL